MIAEHAELVSSSLAFFGVPETDLEDAGQEVFLAAFRRMRDYQERGQMSRWLQAICRRVAWSWQRSLRRRRNELAHLRDRCQAVQKPVQYEYVEAAALGRRLLSTLPPAQREVFLLCAFEGLSVAEISSALNCPVQTIYSRLHSIRERVVAATVSQRE
jgi:RNA polymerase sigma-70 factor (ECF subfamily)